MSADHKPASPRRPVLRPVVDSVTTIASDGSRRDLHPADVHGRFTFARRWSGWALIASRCSGGTPGWRN